MKEQKKTDFKKWGLRFIGYFVMFVVIGIIFSMIFGNEYTAADVAISFVAVFIFNFLEEVVKLWKE